MEESFDGAYLPPGGSACAGAATSISLSAASTITSSDLHGTLTLCP